jgi:hypothetical protein
VTVLKGLLLLGGPVGGEFEGLQLLSEFGTCVTLLLEPPLLFLHHSIQGHHGLLELHLLLLPQTELLLEVLGLSAYVIVSLTLLPQQLQEFIFPALVVSYVLNLFVT